MPIEHAVYASAQTELREGYQIVAASDGIRECDLQEIPAWCPSHDGLTPRTSQSVSFFPLPGGTHCVTRSRTAPGDYSARGGEHIITHCLVLDRGTLARFANNPFSIVNATVAGGHCDVHAPWPSQLDAFELRGRARPLDRLLLQDVLRTVGPKALSRVLDTCCRAETTGIVAGAVTAQLMAAVLNCIPVAMRPDILLASALRFSPQWDFHWMGLDEDDFANRRIQAHYGVDVVVVPPNKYQAATAEISDSAENGLQHNWARFVAACLETGRLDILDRQVRTQPHMTLGRLNEVASEFCETAVPSSAATRSTVRIPHGSHQRSAKDPPSGNGSSSGTSTGNPKRAEVKPVGPAELTHSQCPEVVRELEKLDDTMFSAIRGEPEALALAEALWHQVVRSLGPELVEESREQYLRYAMTVWEESQAEQEQRTPEHAAAALEIITLLSEDA